MKLIVDSISIVNQLLRHSAPPLPKKVPSAHGYDSSRHVLEQDTVVQHGSPLSTVGHPLSGYGPLSEAAVPNIFTVVWPRVARAGSGV